jgi:hypothetical protein
MRYRQIHLDFHTSERIPDIGSRFDPNEFGRTFAKANVDSVTIFSKCHHGVSYHPTKVGKQHPNLSFDLTRAQLDALHKHGINAPIYVSAGWDELAARENPGWRVVTPEGVLVRQRGEPLGPGWAFLDFNSPYLDYLCRQVDEVIDLFPDGDGIFIDICFALVTVSTWAQAKMEAQGLDWTSPEDRLKFTEQTQIEFFERVSKAARRGDPKRPLFFNFGHVRRGRRDILKYAPRDRIAADRLLGLRALSGQRPLCRYARHRVFGHDRKIPSSLGRGRRLQEARRTALRVWCDARAGRQMLDRRSSASDRIGRPDHLSHHRRRLRAREGVRAVG